MNHWSCNLVQFLFYRDSFDWGDCLGLIFPLVFNNHNQKSNEVESAGYSAHNEACGKKQIILLLAGKLFTVNPFYSQIYNLVLLVDRFFVRLKLQEPNTQYIFRNFQLGAARLKQSVYVSLIEGPAHYLQKFSHESRKF